MEVDGISVIRSNFHPPTSPKFQHRESLLSARNLLHDGALRFRKTDSHIVSSVETSSNDRQLPAGTEHIRSATELLAHRTEQNDPLAESSSTTKTVVMEKPRLKKADSSERTESMRKRKKIFIESTRVQFRIPPLQEYYHSPRAWIGESTNGLNLSFAEDTRQNLFMERGGELLKTGTEKNLRADLDPTRKHRETEKEKEKKGGLSLWVSFMAAVLLIMLLRACTFL